MNFINYSDEEVSNRWNDYAATRNKGLKKMANLKLKDLIEYINSQSEEDRERFVDYLCSERFEKGNIKDFQQPLIEGLVLPEIIEAVKADKMPYLRWIYQLELYSSCNYKNIDNIEYYNSEDILIKANKIDASDIKTVHLLLEIYMDRLWFGSHHLPEFILIETDEVDNLLKKVDNIVERYGDKISNIKNLLEEFSYYKDLYKSWFKYKKDCSNITFNQWCENNKKNYYWGKSFYYKNKNQR
ncbi:hypothetical protein [Wukongibacter baidiensis]